METRKSGDVGLLRHKIIFLATLSCIDIVVAILGWLVAYIGTSVTLWHPRTDPCLLHHFQVTSNFFEWQVSKSHCTGTDHNEKRQQEGTASPHLASSRSLFIAQKGSHSLTHSPPSLDSRQTLESEEEEELWMETSTTRWAGRGLVMQWSSTIWTESKFQHKGGNFYKEALIW